MEMVPWLIMLQLEKVKIFFSAVDLVFSSIYRLNGESVAGPCQLV